MPVPLFLCVLLEMFNKLKFEGIMYGMSYLYPWSVNLDYISLLNGSNFITACKERKMINKENIVFKKFLLIHC